jgi:polyphosphate glucokinase
VTSTGLLFGVDVGGSGIKGAIVDPITGRLTEKRRRIPTPQPSTPEAVARTVNDIVRHFRWSGPIGVTVPGVVQAGVVSTAANIDDGWIGTNAAELMTDVTGQPVRVLNDADAAGIAEMRYGAGAGVSGLIVLLTFGTGIGSAMFYDGVLIPNTEFGHLEFRGGDAEWYAAARNVERDEMDLVTWSGRAGEFLRYLESVLTPDLFVFGGGISKRFDEFSSNLDVATPVRAAELRNNAGIVGAALAGPGLDAGAAGRTVSKENG